MLKRPTSVRLKRGVPRRRRTRVAARSNEGRLEGRRQCTLRTRAGAACALRKVREKSSPLQQRAVTRGEFVCRAAASAHAWRGVAYNLCRCRETAQALFKRTAFTLRGQRRYSADSRQKSGNRSVAQECGSVYCAR